MDPGWRAIEIDCEGWRVVERPAVRFRRPRGSQPLPLPEHGGSIEELHGYLNVDAEGWALIKAFLVMTLRSSTPVPDFGRQGRAGFGEKLSGSLPRGQKY